MNRKYAKLTESGALQYAPNAVRTKTATVLNPSAATYKAAGWLPVVNKPPTGVPEGKHAEPRGWKTTDGAIRRIYEIVDDPPPPPRIFSKLKVVAALTKAGVWPEVKEWIERAGLYDLYLAAQDFAEDNGYFVQGLAALKPVVGWTDEQVEALLAQCVKEGA